MQPGPGITEGHIMHASTLRSERSITGRARRGVTLLQCLAAPETRLAVQLLGWAIVAALPAIMLIALSVGAGPSVEHASALVAQPPARP
jgi:hypothetical protein